MRTGATVLSALGHDALRRRRPAALTGAGVEARVPFSALSGVEVAVGTAAVAAPTAERAGFAAGLACFTGGLAAGVAVAAGVATAARSLSMAAAAVWSGIGPGRARLVAERQRHQAAEHDADQQGGGAVADPGVLVPGEHGPRVARLV